MRRGSWYTEHRQVELIDEAAANRSLNWPRPAVPMNMPKMVALPTKATSAPLANFDDRTYGTGAEVVKSITSKKYPAAINATIRWSGDIFASSSALPTYASMV
jgi:hypothetical protein